MTFPCYVVLCAVEELGCHSERLKTNTLLAEIYITIFITKNQ